MILVALDGAGAIINALDDLNDGKSRAIVRSLNRAIKAARTVEVQDIAADTGLKQADVRAALTLKTAYAGVFQASLSAGLKRTPLIDFRATGPEPSRGQPGGVTYQLQGGAGNLPNAFIATMATGHRGVFERVPDKYMRVQKPTWKKKRQAIQEKFGPSIGHVFLKYVGEAVARAEDTFLMNFEHELVFAGPPVPQDLESTDAAA